MPTLPCFCLVFGWLLTIGILLLFKEHKSFISVYSQFNFCPKFYTFLHFSQNLFLEDWILVSVTQTLCNRNVEEESLTNSWKSNIFALLCWISLPFKIMPLSLYLPVSLCAHLTLHGNNICCMLQEFLWESRIIGLST